jgi:hypothetical protein
MAQDLSTELGKLLDQYDANRRAVEERKRQVKIDEDGFQHGFSELRAQVIRPVFEVSGEILKSRGHDFSILEAESEREPGGKVSEASIAIQVVPAGMEGATPAPSQRAALSFVTRHYNRTVCVLASNAVPKPSGAAGSRGDYQLAQIDAAFVQGEVLKLIAGIVNK